MASPLDPNIFGNIPQGQLIDEPIEPNADLTVIEDVDGGTLSDDDRIRRALGISIAGAELADGGQALPVFEEAVATSTTDELFDRWTDRTATKGFKRIVDNSMDTAPLVQQAQAAQLQANLSNDNPRGQSVEHIKTLPTAPELSRDEIMKEALYLRYSLAQSQWAEQSANESGWESLGTFLGVGIPKRTAIDTDELLSALGLNTMWTDSLDTIINDTDEIRRFRNFYADLTPPEQLVMLDDAVAIIDVISDNPELKSQMLNAMFGVNFEGESFRTAINIIDNTGVLEVIQLAKWVIKSGFQMTKMSNSFNRLKDHESLAKLAKDSTDDPSAPQDYSKINYTPGDTVNEADLILGKEARVLAVGAPTQMASKIKWILDEQEEWTRQILNDTNREGIQNHAERELTRERVTKRLEEHDYVQDGSVKMTPIDDHTFKVELNRVSYDKRGKETVTPVSETGSYTVEGIKTMHGVDTMYHDDIWLFDPKARMDKELMETFVTLPEKLGPQQSKTTAEIEGIVRLAFKGLNGKNAENLDRILRHGRDHNEVYDWETLTKIGYGKENITLSEKEAVAYLGVRNAMDKSFLLQNRIVTENMSARNVKLYQTKTQTVPSKVYDDPQVAHEAFIKHGQENKSLPIGKKGSPHIAIMGRHFRGFGGAINGAKAQKAEVIDGIYDMKTWDDIDPAFIDEAYERGYVLVKNDQGSNYFRKGRGKTERYTEWAMVKRNELVDPRGKVVLRRQVGYMPIARTNGHFFISTTKAGVLSGSKGFKTQTTVAWSDTEGEALKWIEKNGGSEKYSLKFDREMDSTQLMYESNHVNGGMYTGARRTEPPEFVGNQGKGKFQGSFEALQGMINHIGRQYPINLVRMGIEDRALRIGRELLDDKNIHSISRLGALAKEAGVPEKTRKILSDIVNQVNFLNNVPTDKEIEFSKRLLRWGQAWERKFPSMKTVPRLLYSMSGKGVQGSDILRSITFSHMLGMYNPAQVLVQASGFLVSFAINPVYFVKSAPRAYAFGLMDLVPTNPSAQKKAFEELRKMGIFGDDIIDEYKIYQKSGLLQNVTNSNADYTSVFTKNLPYDAGVIRKTMQNHTMFYKMGEMVNTRHAFSTAISWYKDTYKVNKIPDTKEALGLILDRTETYRLNMSRANTSDLNRGWQSVPLQFQQVTSKYFEKVFKGSAQVNPDGSPVASALSATERIRLGMIPTIATGIAGVPMLEEVMLGLMNLGGLDMTELSVDETELLKYGALGWLLHEKGNVNVDLTTRMQLGVDIPEKLWLMLSQPSANWHALAGPSASIGQKYAQQLQFIGNSLDLYTDIDESTTLQQDVMVAGKVLFDVITEIPTLSKNIKQYYAFMLIDNPAFYKNGQYLLDFEDMNGLTALMAIAGFQPSEISEAYEMSRELREKQGGTKGAPTFLRSEAQVIARLINLGLASEDPAMLRGIELMTGAIFRNRTPQEAETLNSQVQDIMFDKKLDQNKLFNDLMTVIIETSDEGLSKLNTTFAKKLQENR